MLFPMARLAMLVLAMLALAPIASAADDEVDLFVQQEMERQKIPGVAIAVARQGKMVKAKGYGLANLEHPVAVAPETVFQMASVGKQFTAAAVLLLAEEKRLGLDDPIKKHLPEGPALWEKITIRHLLQHTSGIPDYDGRHLIDLRKDYTEVELVKLAAGLPQDFEPGADWGYSNTGYVLLGVIIHRVSGKFYGDYLQEKVFGPLEMKATRVISEADIIPHRAAGYRLLGGQLKNQQWVSPALNTTADGALYTTVLDLVKWDAALYTERPLSAAIRETMWTPARFGDNKTSSPEMGNASGYGCGWYLAEDRGHRIVKHSGDWQGFRTHIRRGLDEGLTVIVLMNLAEGQPAAVAEGIARRVAEAPK